MTKAGSFPTFPTRRPTCVEVTRQRVLGGRLVRKRQGLLYRLLSPEFLVSGGKDTLCPPGVCGVHFTWVMISCFRGTKEVRVSWLRWLCLKLLQSKATDTPKRHVPGGMSAPPADPVLPRAG